MADEKLKILYLMQILLDETDKDHVLSATDLASRMDHLYHITCNRKTVYTDVEKLRSFGLKIEQVKGSNSGYYVAEREFELPELKLLVDAVQSAKFITTKKSDELMAHAYAKLYNIPSTGLRFFTVYGAAGRPDMAYFGFTNRLRAGEKIRIFNFGHCKRDFTYIDDIVEGVVRVMQGAPERQSGADGLPIAPYRIYNIGNGHPVDLLDFVDILQQELVAADVLPQDYDFEAHKELVPMQPGDVPVTYADTTALEQDFGYRPRTDLRTGLRTFAVWYKKFYCEG